MAEQSNFTVGGYYFDSLTDAQIAEEERKKQNILRKDFPEEQHRIFWLSMIRFWMRRCLLLQSDGNI